MAYVQYDDTYEKVKEMVKAEIGGREQEDDQQYYGPRGVQHGVLLSMLWLGMRIGWKLVIMEAVMEFLKEEVKKLLTEAVRAEHLGPVVLLLLTVGFIIVLSSDRGVPLLHLDSPVGLTLCLLMIVMLLYHRLALLLLMIVMLLCYRLALFGSRGDSSTSTTA